MSERILVVAPHPDDETLGCGGALLKHKKKGDSLFWMIMTNIHVQDGWSPELIQQSQKEITVVSQMYGVDRTVHFDHATRMLDTIPYYQLVSNISEVMKEIRPSVLYIPNRSDIHTDHRVAFNAVMSCCKDFRAPYMKRILMYECLSETEFSPALSENAFVPNVFVDITEHFERKIEIFEVFSSEVMAAPLPRSLNAVKGLAQYRGSRIGVEYAEAFALIMEKA